MSTPYSVLRLVVVWCFYDVCTGGRCVAARGVWRWACAYHFFVYLCHEPALNIFKKLPVAILGEGDVVLAVSYLLSPWLMYVSAALVAAALRRFLPGVYAVLVGGRVSVKR